MRPKPNKGHLRFLRVEAVHLTVAPLPTGHRCGEDNDDRRRPTAGYGGQDETEHGRGGENVQKDGVLTLVAWMLVSVKEEVRGGGNRLDGASPSAGKKGMVRSIYGVPRRFRR